MSVYAKAMAQKAMEQKQKNFKETGIYETNIQRERREKQIILKLKRFLNSHNTPSQKGTIC